MLRYGLLHPQLLDAFATAGHGSRVLFADGNFPALTVRSATARVVHLNIAPGLVSITDLLPPVLTAANFEAATVMAAPPELDVPVQTDYRRMLPKVPFTELDRFAFYDAVVRPDVGLIIATGDERIYANLLLTVGLR